MKRQKIEGSSNILEVGYDNEKLTLQIKFKGNKIYNYKPITQEGYELLMASKSRGEFFFKNIRDDKSITCTRVG